MLFTVKFVTYKGLYRTIQTDKLNVPAIDGRRTLLSNHMPIIIPLEVGVIETSKDNIVSHYAISEGMVQFEDNEATVLCDEIINVEEIDVERAEKSLHKAQDKLNTAVKEGDILRAKVALERAANLIHSKDKYYNK